MGIRAILLTVSFLTIGSSLALAENTTLITDQDTGAAQAKIERLESKIQALESRINQYLPKDSNKIELTGNPYESKMVQQMVNWSSNDHLQEAKVQHQKIQDLENRIGSINERIDRFNKKPYLDTKGFKRSSLKHIKENLVQDLRQATMKTAWHKEQAEKSMFSETADVNQQQHS